MKSNLFYAYKDILRFLLAALAVAGLMRVTNGAGFIVVVPFVLVGLVLHKTESLFFWLIFAECMLIANPNVVFKGAVFAWTQRGLMLGLGLCMAVQVIGKRKHQVFRPFLFIYVYLCYMLLPSAVGWCPIISFLKLLLFTLVYFSYFGVANQVGISASVSSKKIRAVMLTFAILFVFGSVALVPFPGLSQLDAKVLTPEQLANLTTSLFMGMTNQSQCLGPCISCIAVVVFGDMLFSIKRLDKLYVAILLCCPYLIYLTSSRTGMGAFVSGISFVVFLFIKSRGVRKQWKSKILSLSMGLIAVGAIFIACSGNLSRSVAKFILKSDRAESADVSAGNIISSRYALMENSLQNFMESPVIGNGFQVSELMQDRRVTGLASILSAPIEKGVWISAVLEEGGIIGLFLFVTFLVVCIVVSIRKRAYIGASCLFVVMMANFGEFSFFSMSYTGGFEWAMVFTGLALDVRKMHDENQELRRQMLQDQLAMGLRMGV